MVRFASSVYPLRTPLAIKQIGADGDWLMDQNMKRRVYVVVPDGCTVTEIDALKLLSDAEIDLATVQFVKAEADFAEIASHDAVVIVLDRDHTSDATAEAAALAAAQVGVCAIVGVWAPGQESDGIHPLLLQFGTAQRPWDPGKLKNELGSDCEKAFQNPDGSTSEPNEIEPNECE
ncbi:hypothetical protein HY29_14080 [Hyphomonas beringensis]|uniref:Uncharacterized protein n=1 Tax=Hyphomonas beringensis TaxID=1280946 RepID=A0A062UDN6_9PROT|nr:hypothetical protein [Hyphomonas beringensis]KCZ54674.1 hypothetical protein HY29_14080 [Hyphomonas beringensis]